MASDFQGMASNVEFVEVFDLGRAKRRILALYGHKTIGQLISKLEGIENHVQLGRNSFSLEGLNFEDYDLLLLEVSMVDGFNDIKLMTDLRAMRPLVPIVIISSHTDQDFIIMAYERGATDFLSHDIDAKILSTKIRSLCAIADSSRILVSQTDEVLAIKNILKDEKDSRLVAEEEVEHLRQLEVIMEAFPDGFFFVGADGLIGSVFSKKCQKILGEGIAGKTLGEVLKLTDNRGLFIEYCAAQAFDDILPVKSILEMLPHQVKTLDNRTLSLTYRMMRQDSGKVDKLVFFIKDITAELIQKNQIDEDRNTSNSLITILKNREQFALFLEDFRNEIERLKTIEDRNHALKILHTIKGNAGLFGLDGLARQTHLTETMVSGAVKDDIVSLVLSYIALVEQLMRNFLASHNDVLAMNYDEASITTYVIDQNTLSGLQDIAQSAEEETAAKINETIFSITNRPISLLVGSYAQSVKRLAMKLIKDVDFQMTGVENRVDLNRYGSVFRNLVHALNNAVDHGIEDPPTRAIRGKSKRAKLELDFHTDDFGALLIRVKDDGGGIDRERIKRIAVNCGLYDEDAIEGLNNQEIDMLIFHQGLSIANEVSRVSGRGIGMAALKDSVETLCGTIQVESTPLVGTMLEINIPPYGMNSRHGEASILILEDEPDLRCLYEDILSHMGYRLASCDNGFDGMLELTRSTFDLVITDLSMPGMTGDVLIEKIRNVRKNMIPIIVMSGYLTSELVEHFNSIHNVFVLPKGSPIHLLREMVGSVLAKNRNKQELLLAS